MSALSFFLRSSSTPLVTGIPSPVCALAGALHEGCIAEGDFERASCVVTLDELSHGHYLATDGKEREYCVYPRPLSWRARGEDCLIADRRPRKSSSIAGTYRLRGAWPGGDMWVPPIP
jgi:hypothetical protein